MSEVRFTMYVHRTLLQCTCDQQRLGPVSASTHYMKQASWIARSPKKVHTVRSAKDLVRMCCCSRTFYLALDIPTIEVKYDQRILYQNFQLRRLTRVTRRTRCFVKPRDCRRHIRLAKALIRLLMCRIRVHVQADTSLRTSFIVGFAMHRLLRDLFVQTITLSPG